MKTAVIIAGITGRMGSLLASLAEQQGLEIKGVLDRAEVLSSVTLNVPRDSDPDALLARTGSATIIDFTAPCATMANLKAAVKHNASMVIGTTGLDATQKNEVIAAARSIPVFMSPNMSLGINALCMILPKLAALLGDSYDIEITEVHHKHKKDAPSGTAIRLGECLATAQDKPFENIRCFTREGIHGERPKGEIGVQSVRGGDVAGIHTVYFLGEGERIEVSHHAHSRENFARGALRAAEWLSTQRPGRLYTMEDLLA